MKKQEKRAPVDPGTLPETPETGLTEEEAARRRGLGLDNRCNTDPGKSAGQILAENFFSPFNLLNFALAACLILVGSYRNMLFLGVVFSNTFIGTFQELRAKHMLRKLQVLSAPTAHVLRAGQERPVAPEELVLGDLCVLRGGDQVLADGVVLSGQAAANESLLTGESNAVTKRPGDELLSGSYVMEGRAVQRLTRVGDDSYANRLVQDAKAIKPPRSALMTDLDRLVKLVSIVLIPLGVLLFLKQVFLNHDTVFTAVPAAVAAMIGMIPEGLMLLVSVALAVGVVKLGRKGTLVQELYGIETLARVDTLCLDKTGTLTRGDMQLEELIPIGAKEAELRASLALFLGAFDDPSPTLEALRKACPPKKADYAAILPFSSARKKSAVTLAGGETLVLGAPNFVLPPEMLSGVQSVIEQKAQEGLRVMALAVCAGAIDGETLPPVTKLLGLCCLTDVLRDNVCETLDYFRRQGVTLKVISGDDPRTVASIARRVGLTGWEHFVDASTLQTDEALAEAARTCAIFGRVTPEQKRKLVESLKRDGHSVAMTGDGVNDIPALKAADCSIAMAGGSDAARHAAQLNLLSADFSGMPQVVAEGRRVINNITRAASLFLVKTIYSFLLAVLLLIFPMSYPFQPVQLTLISSLTIGIPSFFLALEPNDERVQGRFLLNVLRRALPGGLAVALSVIAVMAAGPALGLAEAACSTIAALTTGFVGLWTLVMVCRPFNWGRGVLCALMAGSMVATVRLLGHVFFLTHLQGAEFLVLLGACALALGVWFAAKALLKRYETTHMEKLIQKLGL